MDQVITKDFEKRQAETLAMARDPHSWLTDGEKIALRKSGMEIEGWVELTYGISVKDWMTWKKTDSIRKNSTPKIFEKSTPSPAKKTPVTIDADEEKITELKLLKRYTRIESGKTIIIMKLSRKLRFEEVDMHRSANCIFFNSCVTFTDKNKIHCFSCIACPQAKNLKK